MVTRILIPRHLLIDHLSVSGTDSIPLSPPDGIFLRKISLYVCHKGLSFYYYYRFYIEKLETKIGKGQFYRPDIGLPVFSSDV